MKDECRTRSHQLYTIGAAIPGLLLWVIGLPCFAFYKMQRKNQSRLLKDLKLYPTQMARDMDTTTKDMKTSLSTKFKKMDQISVVTRFNTGPFETWKSGFRECAKLSSKVIDRQKEDETNERLKSTDGYWDVRELQFR